MKRLAASLIGIVFFLSGMMKLVDSVGTGLIVDEYYRFFHLAFPAETSLPAGVVLSCVEALTGVALITGVWRKAVAVLCSVMVAFFTLVTVVLAVKNPHMDCGCFGEVIHLSHFQTLLKNVVLLLLSLVAFLPFSRLGVPKSRKYVSFALGLLCVAGFAIRSMTGLPLVDYTEMKPGSELFGDVPVLSLSDTEGEYCEWMFQDTDVLAVVLSDPSSLSPEDWAAVASSLDDAENAGFQASLFVASTPDDLTRTLSSLDAQTALRLYSCSFFADRRKLLTLNRSNGGMVYLSSGTVIRKWHSSSLPDVSDMISLSERIPLEEMISHSERGKLLMRGTTAVCLTLLLVL